MGSSTQDEQMNERPDKPSEYTYRDYRAEVELAGEVALEALSNHGDDFHNVHEAVEYALRGSSRFTNYGHMLVTVLLSDQNPDHPDYCERWQAYVDLGGDPTWADVVQEMAYVCYYSDVMDWCVRQIEAAIAAEAGL